MSDDCIFCKIVDGKIPAKKIFENDDFLAFWDLHPQAKIHFLVVPKKHVASLVDAFPENGKGENELIGELFSTAVGIARVQGLLPGGFRSVINTGKLGGQTVFHLHLHILGSGTGLTERFG